MSFKDNVLNVVRDIPEGEVRTYSQIAEAAGNKKAYRAVGNILNKNYDSDIPCHRVIRADGSPGGYNRGSDLKVKRLRKEGAVL